VGIGIADRNERAGERVHIGVGLIPILVEVGVLAGKQIQIAVGRERRLRTRRRAADDDLVVGPQVDIGVGDSDSGDAVRLGVDLDRERAVAVNGEVDLTDTEQRRAGLDIDLGEIARGDALFRIACGIVVLAGRLEALTDCWPSRSGWWPSRTRRSARRRSRK